MDTRIEQRKKGFKKTFEDSRRRREEQQVQIRKSQREERFSKRRQAACGDAGSAESGVGSSYTALPGGDAAGPNSGRKESVQAAVQMTVRKMKSEKSDEIAAAAFELRRLLSVQVQPPIADVIEAGAVPRLIELLGDDSSPSIQFDVAWSLTNIASGDHDQTAVVVHANAVPIFARLLQTSPSSEVREQSAWALGNIAGDCVQFRDVVLAADVLQPMINELRSAMRDSGRKSVLINCCWALSNFCRGKPRPNYTVIAACIPVLKDIIFAEGDVLPDVVADACWALSYVTDGNDERSFAAIDAVIATGVCRRLVSLLGSQVSAVQTPALRVVGNIVAGSEAQTQAMLDAGCLQALRPLLIASRRLVRKEACWTLSNVTAGTPAQIAEAIRSECIADLLNMLPLADPDTRQEGWWALANAASGAAAPQVKLLMDLGAMKQLALILQSPVERKLLCVVLEALDNVFLAGMQYGVDSQNPNPYTFLLEEENGYTALEKLQYLPDGDKARELAVQLIRKYMQFDEEPAGGDDDSAGNQNDYDFSHFSMQ